MEKEEIKNINPFFDYFEKEEEYPENLAERFMPMGECWHYVSVSLLNGILNHTEIVAAYLVNHYKHWQHHIEKYNLTKEELYKKVCNGELDIYHTDLSMFDDDIVILSKSGENCYFYFYFDSDVSDCSIGKFTTSDPAEIIIKKLEYQYKGSEFEISPLPITSLMGWLKF